MSTSKLKISIAALSLCVSAVAIYIHLPYVIAAVSGSGAIEAVPLAIFTVSAVIALASVAYLIKLAVSPQTEMEDKSSVPPSSNSLSINLTVSGPGNVNIGTKNDNMLMKAGVPMLEKVSNRQIDEVGTPEDQTNTGKRQPMLGAQPNTSASVPPPPPPPVLGAQPNTSASVPPPPPPPPVPNKSGKESGHTASQVLQEKSVNQDELNATLSNDGDERETYSERVERLQAERREMPPVGRLSIMTKLFEEIRKGVSLKKVESQPGPGKKSGRTASQVPQEMLGAQPNTSASVPPPPPPPPVPNSNKTSLPKKANSPSDSNVKSDMSNGDKEQNKQSFAPAQANASIEATHETGFNEELRNCENEPVNFQPENEKRSEGSDSAYGSKSSSPLCFESEAEKPQVPASLQEEPSVTKVNVDPVNSRA